MPQTVTDPELLWVVDATEPPTALAVSQSLPINKNSTYVRLRSLDRRGYLDRDNRRRGKRQHYSLTDRGETRLANADLPPSDETEFETFFAGRNTQLDPVQVLRELAGRDGEWHPSPALYDDISFTKMCVRNRLHALQEEGAIELDDSQQTYRWRLTEAGRERLREAAADRETNSTPP